MLVTNIRVSRLLCRRGSRAPARGRDRRRSHPARLLPLFKPPRRSPLLFPADIRHATGLDPHERPDLSRRSPLQGRTHVRPALRSPRKRRETLHGLRRPGQATAHATCSAGSPVGAGRSPAMADGSAAPARTTRRGHLQPGYWPTFRPALTTVSFGTPAAPVGVVRRQATGPRRGGDPSRSGTRQPHALRCRHARSARREAARGSGGWRPGYRRRRSTAPARRACAAAAGTARRAARRVHSVVTARADRGSRRPGRQSCAR